MVKKKSQNELEMYFKPKIAAKFAEQEQNEKNFRVADIVDRIIMFETKNLEDPLCVVELGGGSHPDRYHRLFKRLVKHPRGHIDWVDISNVMLGLAKKYIDTNEYRNRIAVIDFVEYDILDYLEKCSNEKFDLAIMKYTLDHMADLEKLFYLLSRKLKINAVFIATITNLQPELKSVSTNARFFYKGKKFPENETKTLKDGDSFTIKFFKESGNPKNGYIKGAETKKYYHSSEKIIKLAKKYNFDIFLGDWKKLIPEKDRDKENMDQDILVLRKIR